MKLFKITPTENSEFEIALVYSPAIEQEFLYFSTDKKETYEQFNEEKMQILGPVMIPNMIIPRMNEFTGEEYGVVYDAQAIEKASRLFFRNGTKLNIGHSMESANVEVIESYILKEQVGMLPVGTWMMRLQVIDNDLWQSIKNEEFKGFSIQSIFDVIEKQEMQKQYFSKQQTNMKNKLIEKMSALIDMMFDENDVKVEMSAEEAPIVPETEVKLETPAEVKDEVEVKVDEPAPVDVIVTDVKEEEKTVVEVEKEAEIQIKEDEKYAELSTKYAELSSSIEKLIKQNAELVAKLDTVSKQEISKSVKEVDTTIPLDVKTNPALRFF